MEGENGQWVEFEAEGATMWRLADDNNAGGMYWVYSLVEFTRVEKRDFMKRSMLASVLRRISIPVKRFDFYFASWYRVRI